jgi:hypothetical protein
MNDDLIFYKVRPSYLDEGGACYLDEYSKDNLVFLSADALAIYLKWTKYPCTVSTVREGIDREVGGT